MTQHHASGAAASGGIALVLGLLLLAAISLLAVMAANGMLLQRRMAANDADRGRALQNADLATAAARAWLDSRADVERQAGCQVGCVLPPAIHAGGALPADPEFESAAWWRSNGVAVASHPETGDPLGTPAPLAGEAWWLIEESHIEPFGESVAGPAVGAVGYYRIFGRGSGIQSGSVAVTEAVVARPWEGSYQPAPYPQQADAPDFCRQFDAAVPCGQLAWRQRK